MFVEAVFGLVRRVGHHQGAVDAVEETELGAGAKPLADEVALDPVGQVVPVGFFPEIGGDGREGGFALPGLVNPGEELGGQPMAELRTRKDRAIVQAGDFGGKFAAQGMNLVRGQTGGDDVFGVGFFVGKGEETIQVGNDESAARSDGQGQAERPDEDQHEGHEIVPHAARDTGIEALKDVVGKDQLFAGDVEVGEITVRAVEPEAVTKTAGGMFGDLLDDGDLGNEVRGGEGVKTELVGAGAVEVGTKGLGRLVEDDLVEVIGPVVHPGNLGRQPAIEFEVDGAGEKGQLVVVWVVGDVPLALLDDLEVLTVDGLEGDVFHGTARSGAGRSFLFVFGVRLVPASVGEAGDGAALGVVDDDRAVLFRAAQQDGVFPVVAMHADRPAVAGGGMDADGGFHVGVEGHEFAGVGVGGKEGAHEAIIMRDADDAVIGRGFHEGTGFFGFKDGDLAAAGGFLNGEFDGAAGAVGEEAEVGGVGGGKNLETGVMFAVAHEDLGPLI